MTLRFRNTWILNAEAEYVDERTIPSRSNTWYHGAVISTTAQLQLAKLEIRF